MPDDLGISIVWGKGVFKLPFEVDGISYAPPFRDIDEAVDYLKRMKLRILKKKESSDA